ncbi:hypothetical protein HPB50_021772 [Hyalomma asiaticum]|uniref:Uncharacterized protein n=1 Tax=Hyalomma asiaticum TaxID=266040 RepID=A0ACB7S6Y7_HYAAI|nr:hypothetical protein HPB50_021772 [Hyalomma asiaticum]
MSKLRGYKESYEKFGFVNIGGKPQCVLCGEVLALSSMVPTKLTRHPRTKHPSYQDKDIEFFETKKRHLESQSWIIQTRFGSAYKVRLSFQLASSADAIKASYMLIYHVAKQMKPHTICETLLMPCMKDVVGAVIGKEHVKKLDKIPCSNDTVARRIGEMVSDVQDQSDPSRPVQERQLMGSGATPQLCAAAPVPDDADLATVPSTFKKSRRRDKPGSGNPRPGTDTARQEGAPQSPTRSRRHKKKKHHRVMSVDPSEHQSPAAMQGDVAEAARELRRATEVEQEAEVLLSASAHGGDQEKEPAYDTRCVTEEDNVIAIFGGNGAYQRLSLGFTMMVYFSVSVHLFIDAVIERDVRFACVPPSWANASLPGDDSWSTTQGWSNQDDSSACRHRRHPESGDVTVPCHTWLYENASRHDNIVKEWDMVCSRQWLRPFTRFAFIAGGLVAWVLPFLIDQTGRRPMILLAVVAASLLSLAIYFVKSVLLFMICRFLLGVSMTILYITSFVLMFEIVSREYLALFAVISQLGFCGGQIFVAMLNSPQLTWRSVQLSYSLPVGACAVAFLIVSESPRWLMARGHLEQAEAVMMNAARLNGVSKRKAQFLWKKAYNDLEKSQERWSTAFRMPMRGLLVSSINVRFVLVMFVSRFSCTLVYLSVVTHFVQRSTHAVFEVKYLATLDMATVVAGGAFLERYGRLRTSAVCLFIAGVAWTLTAFVQSVDDLEFSILVIIGVLAQATVQCVLPVLNAELFPQLMLTFGYCWGEASSLLGALGSPYIMLLAGDGYPFVPLLLFALLTLISGAVVLTVPETRRQPAFVRRSAAPSLFEYSRFVSIPDEMHAITRSLGIDL